VESSVFLSTALHCADLWRIYQQRWCAPGPEPNVKGALARTCPYHDDEAEERRGERYVEDEGDEHRRQPGAYKHPVCGLT